MVDEYLFCIQCIKSGPRLSFHLEHWQLLFVLGIVDLRDHFPFYGRGHRKFKDPSCGTAIAPVCEHKVHCCKYYAKYSLLYHCVHLNYVSLYHIFPLLNKHSEYLCFVMGRIDLVFISYAPHGHTNCIHHCNLRFLYVAAVQTTVIHVMH